MTTKFKLAFILIGLLAFPRAYGEELGRLFFTPTERQQLNSSMQRIAMPASDPGGVILNGIVQKHGGKRTAWINGVSQPAGHSDDRSPESMPISVPGSTKPVKIKVGQRVFVDPASTGQ